MAVELFNPKPLAWDSADLDADTREMLATLQPNILRAHVREHLSVLFVRFAVPDDGRRFVRGLVPLMKSARRHLEEVRRFDQSRTQGSPYVGLGLSRSGYRHLGHDISDLRKFGDLAFREGMKKRAVVLDDPPSHEWDAAYQRDIHAVVLVGDSDPEAYRATLARVRALIPPDARILGEETGVAQRNKAGEGIEHFGYVDGRSQPLFLADQVSKEPGRNWDPFFPLSQILVPDPLAPDPDRHFGSYFVFRKLEQNVRAFQRAEQDLADALGLSGPARARAGALLVGRFRNGTPLLLHPDPSSDGWAVQNNFNYTRDPGGKCPMAAHIRKTNPRDGLERGVMMARRGQTYGVRTDQPWDDASPETRPTGGVGLLFMAFNSSLEAQFEFTQQSWANNPDFPDGSVGHDPVIGQGPRDIQVTHPDSWGSDTLTPEVRQIPQTVTMRGGEYFFMPSLAYLKKV
ncbi:peroxidase [Acrocarpospora corrugata]|uniref:Peroxidase n=1 Tax=Acrocarpospora corrugata TaxID=35763 RepID=A0A5M3W1B7_9ACTN|nr:peroxidase [Acrocarpospora corrugata]GES01113.1 peroxidase [Acrocarpospora corrugata]